MRGWSVLISAAAFVACKPQASTPAVEVVGDPLGTWRKEPNEAFARNLWDLQEFRGRLYLGYGDAVANTGPTKVIAFDPVSQAFTQDTVLNEEAIFSLRVFGDRLYVPGIDAVDSPDGALYVRDRAGWKTLRLPSVIHATDVLVSGDELCVLVQEQAAAGVRCTRDNGAAWSSIAIGGSRPVSLFELGRAMYVSSHEGVQRIESSVVPVKLAIDELELHANALVSRSISLGDVLVSRPVHCGNELVFIAKRISYYGSSADVRVFGVFHTPAAASDAIAAKRSPVEGTATDLFVTNGHCYVVTNRPTNAGDYEVTIERSDDGHSWRKQVVVTTDAMARSAELMQGYFYIGTGCDVGQCTGSAGRLLRVRASL